MRALIYLVGIAIASSPARIMAQGAPDFSALHVKVGDRVYITDATTGVEVNGPLAALTETRLVINGYTFRPGPALTIQRDGDSVWNGAAVGFALGAFALYPVVPETFVSQGGRVRVNNGLMWGAIGALVDYAHRGRTTIYRGSSHVFPGSARFLPQFDRGKKGISLAFAF